MSDIRTHQAIIKKAKAQNEKKARGAAISLYGHKKAIGLFKKSDKKAKAFKND